MRAIEQTIEALGEPVFVANLGDNEDTRLVVARWRHSDAAVSVVSTDAVRVLLSLSGEQTVCHFQPDRIVKATGTAGDVGILPAGLPTATNVSGRADIVQIFLKPSDTSRLESAWNRPGALMATGSEALRVSIVRLFVAARAPHCDMIEDSARELIGTVRQALLTAQITRKERHAGGLPPGMMHRLDDLIAARIREPSFGTLSVAELADRAKLSVGHFIRAFRQTTGTTPYQYVLALRRKMALGLLTEPQVSIAEVADLTGFSSPAHFSAAFRESFGVRPGDYRAAVLDVAGGINGV